jgi:threonine synthase
MDIQVASNFERLLFELYGRSGAEVRDLITGLETGGGFEVAADKLAAASERFAARRVDDDRALACMARVWRDCGMLIDPHSAAGVAASEDTEHEVPLVSLATAHPAKFPDAVERATGIRPGLPKRLADLLDRPERVTQLPNDLAAVKAFVAARSAAGAQGKVA